MANEKRLIYLEDAIALLEKDIAENKDALKTAYHGDKDVIRAEMNGVRAAIHILKHHASQCGTVQAVPVVYGRWEKDEPDKCGNRKPRCSVCGEYHLAWWSDYTHCNYCPNCGAKMNLEG